MTQPKKEEKKVQGFANLDDLLKSAENNIKKASDTSNTRKYSDEVTMNIINSVALSANCSIEIATRGIAGVLNQGGTSKRAQRTIFVQIEGTRISFGQIMDALKKEEGDKATPRKLARSLGTSVARLCLSLGIRGNLANKLLHYDSSLAEDESNLVWAADFQQSNPDCPKKVRELLNKYYVEEVKSRGTR